MKCILTDYDKIEYGGTIENSTKIIEIKTLKDITDLAKKNGRLLIDYKDKDPENKYLGKNFCIDISNGYTD